MVSHSTSTKRGTRRINLIKGREGEKRGVFQARLVKGGREKRTKASNNSKNTSKEHHVSTFPTGEKGAFGSIITKGASGPTGAFPGGKKRMFRGAVLSEKSFSGGGGGKKEVVPWRIGERTREIVVCRKEVLTVWGEKGGGGA